MKILVTVKRVPDPETVVKIAPDGVGITTDNVKWVINPFDEIAIEEGLRLKEKVSGTEVVLVSIGLKTAQEQLRTGLAMGADRAILVLSDQALEPLAVARVLQKLVEQEKPELVIRTALARCWRSCSAGPRRRSPRRWSWAVISARPR